jgi:hypothetical protein
MRRSGLILLAVLGAAVAVLLWIRSGASTREMAGSGAPPSRVAVRPQIREATRAADNSGVPGPQALRPDAGGTGEFSRPARTELPHVAVEHYDGGLRQLASPERSPGPTDRRSNPGPRAAQELEAIRYGLETLDDDVSACLDQWNALAGRDAGEVMIAFEIDANGLQRSWVEGDEDVPFGPRTCLANAVFGIDWSHVVDQPVKITNRFALSPPGGRTAK